MTAAPQTVPVEVPDELEQLMPPWCTIVHNDPVNLMSYVTWVFQELFGYSRDKAELLMLDVHQKGRAVVSNGVRERMEHDATRLHSYGLWATVSRQQITLFDKIGSECVATFSEDEVRVLRKVAEEVVGLLTEGFDHGDPVVGRLFPSAYPEDEEEQAEFREYTESDLKTSKIDQAGAILAMLPASGGGEIRLDPEAAQAWLRAVNDARLALGIRLEITDDTIVEYELDEAIRQDRTSSRVFQLSVYSYLGYLQESLLEAFVS